MRIIAFDPGVHHVGWSYFVGDRLSDCGLIRERPKARDVLSALKAFLSMLGHVDQVVIEKPQIYGQANWKGDPADLIELARTVGALAYFFDGSAEISEPVPHSWKGNAKKEAVHGWIDKRLTPVEKVALERGKKGCGKLAHNVVDAVGIGLWAVGRLR